MNWMGCQLGTLLQIIWRPVRETKHTVLSFSEFPTTKLEMTAVADIFDRDGDGYIDYYEFVAALHPNKDAYRPTTDADKIEDEVIHCHVCGNAEIKEM